MGPTPSLPVKFNDNFSLFVLCVSVKGEMKQRTLPIKLEIVRKQKMIQFVYEKRV